MPSQAQKELLMSSPGASSEAPSQEPPQKPSPEPSQERPEEPEATPTAEHKATTSPEVCDATPPEALSEKLSEDFSPEASPESSPESSRNASPAPAQKDAAADQLRSRSGRVVKRKVWSDSVEGSPPASPRGAAQRPLARRRASQAVQAPSSRKRGPSAAELQAMATDSRQGNGAAQHEGMEADLGGEDDDGTRIPVRDQNGKFIGSRPPTAAERKDAGYGPEGNTGRGGIFKSAAISVLQQERRLMSTGDIARIALRRGLIHVQGKTPEATMAAAMYTDVKRKQKRSVFMRPHEGLFGLREWTENGIAYEDPAQDAHFADESLIRGLRHNPPQRPRFRESAANKDPEDHQPAAFPLPVPPALPEVSIGLPQRLLAPGGALSPKALEKTTGVPLSQLREPSPGSPAPLRPRSARRAAKAPGWRRSESQEAEEEEPPAPRSRPRPPSQAQKRSRREESSPDDGLQLLLNAIDDERDPPTVKDEPGLDEDSDGAEVSSSDDEMLEDEEPEMPAPWLGNKHKAGRTARASTPHLARTKLWQRSRRVLGIGEDTPPAFPTGAQSLVITPASVARPASLVADPQLAAPLGLVAGAQDNAVASLLGQNFRFPPETSAPAPQAGGMAEMYALAALAIQFPELLHGTGAAGGGGWANLAAATASLAPPQPQPQPPPPPQQPAPQGFRPAFPSGLAAGNGYLIRPQAERSQPAAATPKAPIALQQQRQGSFEGHFGAAWGQVKEDPPTVAPRAQPPAGTHRRGANEVRSGPTPTVHKREGEAQTLQCGGVPAPSGHVHNAASRAPGWRLLEGAPQRTIGADGAGKSSDAHATQLAWRTAEGWPPGSSQQHKEGAEAAAAHRMQQVASLTGGLHSSSEAAHSAKEVAAGVHSSRQQDAPAAATQQLAQLLALASQSASNGQDPGAHGERKMEAPAVQQDRPQSTSPAAMLLQELRGRAGGERHARKPDPPAWPLQLWHQPGAAAGAASGAATLSGSKALSSSHDRRGQTPQPALGASQAMLSSSLAAQFNSRRGALSADDVVKAYVSGHRDVANWSQGIANAEAKVKEPSESHGVLEQLLGSSHPEVDPQMAKLYQAAGLDIPSQEALERSYNSFCTRQPEDAREGPPPSAGVEPGQPDSAGIDQALKELTKGLGKAGLPTFGNAAPVSVAARTAQ